MDLILLVKYSSAAESSRGKGYGRRGCERETGQKEEGTGLLLGFLMWTGHMKRILINELL
jgi:hypothetical protein